MIEWLKSWWFKDRVACSNKQASLPQPSRTMEEMKASLYGLDTIPARDTTEKKPTKKS